MLLVAALPVAAGNASEPGDRALAVPVAERAAVVVAEGGIARRQVVALGRDLEVHGETREGAAAIGGNAIVSGEIGGDLIVLGGDARLQGSARVVGDAFVLGGRLELAPGAAVDGRMASYPRASPTWLVLLEGPALGLSPLSPQVLGAKTALLAAWLTVGLVLLASSPQALQSTGREVLAAPVRCFVVGLVATLAVTLTTLFLSAFASVVVGVPFVLLVVLAALVAKLWGTVAILLLAGAALSRWVSARPIDPLYALIVGVAVVGAVKYVPAVGVVVWTAITLVGIGATLITKFGRDEPWLEPV